MCTRQWSVIGRYKIVRRAIRRCRDGKIERWSEKWWRGSLELFWRLFISECENATKNALCSKWWAMTFQDYSFGLNCAERQVANNARKSWRVYVSLIAHRGDNRVFILKTSDTFWACWSIQEISHVMEISSWETLKH